MSSQSLLVRPSSRGSARTNSTEAVIGLETAVAGFQAQLKDSERTRLKSLQTTPPNAQSIIEFTEQLDDATIDTFVSSNPETAGLIWGSIKLTFLILANFTSYFKSFVNVLDGFGSLCSRFAEYQRLFGTSVRLRDSICRFHTAVISCCQALVLSTRRSVFSKVSRAILGSFESEMRPYVDGIKAKAEEVQQDIAFVKAKSDHDEHSRQASGRQTVASCRSLALSMFSKHEEQHSVAQTLAKTEERIAEGRLEQLFKELSPYGRHNAAFHSTRSKRHHRTGEWILNAQEFKDWHEKDESTILHITGKRSSVGSGKSVLVSRVIEYLNSTRKPDQQVSFFFCRFDDADCLDHGAILRSLVHQLLYPFSFDDRDPTDTRLMDAIQVAQRNHFDANALTHLYTFAFSLLKTWILVLDGIDECPKDQRYMLLKFLSAVNGLTEGPGKFKIIFSCRETIDTDIQQWFSGPLQISTGAGQTRNDILIYAQDILEEKIESGELVLGDPRLILDILHAIESKEKGMFLWVFLTIEDICSRKTDEDIRKALLDIPMDLDITLNRALERITKEKHQDAAKAIFRWAMVVQVPLNLYQLREALSVEIGQRTWKPASRYNDIGRLTLWCQNLVHIEKEDNTVRFSHHSIKDFLSKPDSGSLATFYFSYPESDHHVGQICLTYLNLDNVNRSTPKEEQQHSVQLNISGFSATEVSSKMLQEALPGEMGITAKRLMNRVVALREKRQPSKSQTLARAELCIASSAATTTDVSPSFQEYAERHWHSHIQFLSEKSDTYELLVRMVNGDMLTNKMPWMDTEWRMSNRHFGVWNLGWDLGSRYAVAYAQSIGNHFLIQHAFKALATHQHRNPDIVIECMCFLDDSGHLDCPEHCISKLQGLLEHQNLMRVIQHHLIIGRGIAGGADSWPAISQPCNCSQSIRETGINADLCQVIATGYSPDRQPFLTAVMYRPSPTSPDSSLEKICEKLKVTEAALLRGTTVLGKTIFDLRAEGLQDPWIEIGPQSWQQWSPWKSLDQNKIVATAVRSGVGREEMQRMITKALGWAITPRLKLKEAEGLFRLIGRLGSDAMSEDSFLDIEHAVNIIMDQELTEEQAQRVVKVYISTINGWPSFGSTQIKLLGRSIQGGKWLFAQALSEHTPVLTAISSGDVRLDLIRSALSCGPCMARTKQRGISEGRRQPLGAGLAFCSLHWEKATTAFYDSMRNGMAPSADVFPSDVLFEHYLNYRP
ncbi:hypothetical protein FALBO_4514 [Fusarium albosuccineum]|uniref:NACHT domain-containing protein n=1 Tax=Fusarium albosuccineum TaxID=1237068 RepID=A0A8H4LJG6_9HYPO|nr:hypothetical protein FALBO_4514 [Fusarium albosuccineum]